MISELALLRAFKKSLVFGRFDPIPQDSPIDGTALPERYCPVSNNDHGIKRILFDIDGVSDFVLDGGGGTLSFFGEVLPIRVGRSSNVTIKNLTIDWVRPFFSQATILASGPGSVEFEADPALYPLRSDRGRLVAHDGRNWQTDSLWNMLPFSAESGEVGSRTENWHLSRWHRAENTGPGRFRLRADFSETYPAGTRVVFMHGNRAAPGIWIEDSSRVRIENVTIHHAPGMAVIAQLSSDIMLDGVRVVPSGDRLFSSWVDAFHFVDCTGATEVEACEARGQFDDAVNIHGNFSRVLRGAGGRELLLQTVHPQRFGQNAATPGTGLAISLHRTMERILTTRVLSATPLNQEITSVILEDSVPDTGQALIASRHNPENTVRIRGCRFGANRGRGCLINIEHDAVIENCHFHVSGTAIESVPDANYWWEGPPIQSLTLRNNRFEGCGFGPCGQTLIRLRPEFPDGSDPRGGALRESSTTNDAGEHPVLRNFSATGNVIDHDAGPVLEAAYIDGLVFLENEIKPAFKDACSAVQLGPCTANSQISIHPSPGG